MAGLTNEEVAEIVESEGLGYAVVEYLSSDAIQDLDLQKLWDEAQTVLNKLNTYLEPHYKEV